MMHPSVKVQIAPSSVPATPSWFGEVAVLAHVLTQWQVSAVVWPTASSASASTAPPPPEAPLMLREPLPSPAESAPFPVLWGDWPRCSIRRRWFQLLRSQTVILPSERIHPEKKQDSIVPERQNRAQRAHWRLSWDERLARNTCPSTDTFLKVTIHGLPATFATLFSLDVVTTA
jgi:hypothetical protein